MRRALIFSAEFVLGPEWFRLVPVFFFFFFSLTCLSFFVWGSLLHTDSTDDGGTAEVLGGRHLGVQLGVPLQLHAVAEVVEGAGGRHFENAFCRIRKEKVRGF